MTDLNRRALLAAAASIPLGVVAAGSARARSSPGQVSGPLAQDILVGLGAAVLPSELGEGGRNRVVAEFQRWLDGYEPGAELVHGYGTAEIRYAPEDPTARWNAQLDALDREATTRFGIAWVDLDAARRRGLVRQAVRGESLERLPDPARAAHVSVGLLAYFYGTPEAVNLCYGALVSPYACRSLADAPKHPERLAVARPEGSNR